MNYSKSASKREVNGQSTSLQYSIFFVEEGEEYLTGACIVDNTSISLGPRFLSFLLAFVLALSRNRKYYTTGCCY